MFGKVILRVYIGLMQNTPEREGYLLEIVAVAFPVKTGWLSATRQKTEGKAGHPCRDTKLIKCATIVVSSISGLQTTQLDHCPDF